ncbi:hypothetical protein FRC96_14385 [Lujinxingia vulgaris]|uniref:Uncharacterized protein n=1 Tax=Lujinxingia vulgaris TaxID=2600176 RepID=A0A5C6X696_9DELT|nr:hypothetical protein [Lujinxingia vulgaris]TXD34217.1 hypothetical protein FRC96_14385 [Lujinxingia vulgaris]
MSTPVYRLMAHAFVATHTWEAYPDVREAMSKAGLNKDGVERGKALLAEAEALVAARKEEAAEDRIGEHAIHMAVAELEMWLQTVRASLRHKVKVEEVIKRALDHHLHASEHTLSAVAGALRTLAVLRTDPRVVEGFGSRRALHDLLIHGQTLLTKVFTLTRQRLEPGLGTTVAPAYDALEAHRGKLIGWLVELDRAVSNVGDRPDVVGLIGYVPPGVGLPLGGASFAVTLHQRAQQSPPDLNSASADCAGWSIGRQGRNRENLGPGFIEPSFE